MRRFFVAHAAAVEEQRHQSEAYQERKADAERERESTRLAQAGTADAEKIRQMAQREIEGAMKAARTELRAFVAEQSVELAETMIRREIRPEDNARMLNKYIDDLHEVSK